MSVAIASVIEMARGTVIGIGVDGIGVEIV